MLAIAVMVLIPAPFAVASPVAELIVATEALLELQTAG
jgi:hypothetical protein